MSGPFNGSGLEQTEAARRRARGEVGGAAGENHWRPQRGARPCIGTSPAIVRRAMTLYVRIPLSLRDAEDLLHERGLKVRRDTMRCRRRLGPTFAAGFVETSFGSRLPNHWIGRPPFPGFKPRNTGSER